MTSRLEMLLVELQEREDVVAFQFFAAFQEGQLNHKTETDDFPAHLTYETGDRARGASRRKQIIYDQDAMPFPDGITESAPDWRDLTKDPRKAGT